MVIDLQSCANIYIEISNRNIGKKERKKKGDISTPSFIYSSLVKTRGRGVKREGDFRSGDESTKK